MEDFLLALIILLLLGRTLGHIFQRYGFHSLIGEVLAGIVLGPVLLYFTSQFYSTPWGIEPTSELKACSELGILMLMLLAGLTTDFNAFKDNKISSIIVGVFGVIATFVLIFIPIYFVLGPIYGIGLVPTLFIAAILSNTAIEVSAMVLIDSKMEKLKSVIMGASFVDDIVAVFLIGLISPLAFSSDQPPIEHIVYLAVLVIIFLTVSLLIATRIFEMIFEKLRGGEGKITLTATLITGLGFALIAKMVGLHEVIGAYIAGLIIGKWGMQVTPLLRRRIAWDKLKYDIDTPLRAIFSPIFFGFIGISVAVTQDISIVQVLPLIIILIILAIAGKIIGCGIGSKISKFNNKESLIIGSAMCGRGALELVLLNYALSIELIDSSIFTALVIVTILTVILTPIFYNLTSAVLTKS